MKKLALLLLGIGLLAGCSSLESSKLESPFQSKEEMSEISALSVSGVVTANQYQLKQGKLKLANDVPLTDDAQVPVQGTDTQTSTQETPAETTTNQSAIDEATKVYESTRALFETSIQTETLESDLEGYQSLQQITYDGQVYKLYVAESTEKKDEEELKVNYHGMIVAQGNEYQYEAIMKTESEEDETEQKNSFKIITDESNYVLIETKEEIEEDEKETAYLYQVVKDRTVIDSYKSKLETENNETEMKVTTLTEQYKFKTVLSEGVLYIRVKDGTEKYTLECKDGNYTLSNLDFDAIEDAVEKDDDKEDDKDDDLDDDKDDDDLNEKDDD